MATVAPARCVGLRGLHAIVARAGPARPRRRRACSSCRSTSPTLGITRAVDGRPRGCRVARRGDRQRRRGDREPARALHRAEARRRSKAGKPRPPRLIEAAIEQPRPEGRGWRDQSRTGRPRCCTTASPATRRRRRRPGRRPRTPSSRGRPCGRCPSSSRRPRAAGDTELARDALERLAETTRAVRHRLGARHRGALPGAAERWRGRRAPVSRGDRAPGPHPAAARARPRAPALRRVAAPRESPGRRACAAPRRPRPVHVDRHGGVRRAGSQRAAGDGREGAQADGRDARRSDRAGAADRPARPRRAVEPGDRCAAVPQPAHRRVAPAQGVRQARDPLAPGARAARCPAPSPSSCRPELRRRRATRRRGDRATVRGRCRC